MNFENDNRNEIVRLNAVNKAKAMAVIIKMEDLYNTISKAYSVSFEKIIQMAVELNGEKYLGLIERLGQSIRHRYTKCWKCLQRGHLKKFCSQVGVNSWTRPKSGCITPSFNHKKTTQYYPSKLQHSTLSAFSNVFHPTEEANSTISQISKILEPSQTSPPATHASSVTIESSTTLPSRTSNPTHTSSQQSGERLMETTLDSAQLLVSSSTANLLPNGKVPTVHSANSTRINSPSGTDARGMHSGQLRDNSLAVVPSFSKDQSPNQTTSSSNISTSSTKDKEKVSTVKLVSTKGVTASSLTTKDSGNLSYDKNHFTTPTTSASSAAVKTSKSYVRKSSRSSSFSSTSSSSTSSSSSISASDTPNVESNTSVW